ncbi:MAG: hypothetical protein DIU65_16775 [Proteobacteria bacterium]|jgi:hypothetical protein|nr:MAG: hypothetical protein DIU65_16775 [Pseudomonadota bacterium]
MKNLVRVFIAMSAALPFAAMAQHEQTRQGFGISFGLGGGSGAVDCSGCDSDRETGASGYLRLGGYVRPDLFVAFESNGFVTSSDGADTTGGFYSVALQWYPNAEKGFYLKGNLGFAGLVEEYDFDEFKVAAAGLGVGVGYDWRLGRNFSLTPYANVIFTGKGDVKFNGSSTGVKASFNLIQIGLGFTWH